jgi:hypothetical protein
MTTTDTTPDESTAEAKIEAKRNALEAVADSDLPLADTAAELLAIADGDDGGDDGE